VPGPPDRKCQIENCLEYFRTKISFFLIAGTERKDFSFCYDSNL
jgi:hypothetical protein